MTTPGESNTNIGILDELAERLGNFHESGRALADCLHTRDITRQTDLSMIEAAKHMHNKLLEKASDDLERVTPQLRQSLHAEATQNKRRYPRPETSIEKSCLRPEAPSERRCSLAETLVEKPCSRSETARQSVLRVDRWSKMQKELCLCTDLESGSTSSRSPS